MSVFEWRWHRMRRRKKKHGSPFLENILLKNQLHSNLCRFFHQFWKVHGLTPCSLDFCSTLYFHLPPSVLFQPGFAPNYILLNSKLLFKLVLLQAAQLGIHLKKEKQERCTSSRDLFKDTYLKKKNMQHLAGIKSTTSLLWDVRSTAVL